MKEFKLLLIGIVSTGVIFLGGCSDDDVPAVENEEEVINKVELLFSATSGVPLTFTAEDPDGDGPEAISIPLIRLAANTTYQLFIKFENTIADVDITDEVEKEGVEHMVFFAFTDEVFANPAGDGNIDNRSDLIGYLDEDDNGLPLGLITTWGTGETGASGTFRLELKHQPGVKSDTSGSGDGETDIDLTFNVEIE